MANPLAPAVHRHADMQLQLAHLQRRGVMVPQQVANQSPVLVDLLRAPAVRHPRRLHDRMIVTHVIDQSDKAVVEHVEPPTENGGEPVNSGAR